MKKSDIVTQVLMYRSTNHLPIEREIRSQLVAALNKRSIDITAWDEEVDNTIGRAIIQHIASSKDDFPIDSLVIDIDLIVKRIS